MPAPLAMASRDLVGRCPGNCYQLGDGLRIDRNLLHNDIRHFFLHKYKSECGLQVDSIAVIVLQGGEQQNFYSTDTEILFKQDPYFHYLFGVEEPGCFALLDVRTARCMLFFPRLSEDHAVWMGATPTLEEYRFKYGVQETYWVDQISDVLMELLPPCLHLLKGVNPDSGLAVQTASFKGIEAFELEYDSLFPVFTDSRVYKGPTELEIMKYCCRVAARSHIQLLQNVRPGMFEYECESAFLNGIYANGACRFAPYTPILGSGPNSAVLHYGHSGAPHARQLLDGDLLLADCGAEYYQYGSDLTLTYPVNGKFNEKQKIVYTAVLCALRAVEAAMRPGVAWPDMQLLAEREILQALTGAGLLRGDVEAQLEARLGALFMPHGLGHFLGKQTHDVGGYLPGKFRARPTEAGLKYLRTARILEEHMVITVEPGCYFVPALLEPQLERGPLASFLVPEVLRQYIGLGGVRLEDNVVVTADGAETLVDLPRTIEEIETVMAGGKWEVPC